ncbi:MAG: hypothetical protein ACRDF9_05835 [Candidatus Limnocylindria bacterium]
MAQLVVRELRVLRVAGDDRVEPRRVERLLLMLMRMLIPTNAASGSAAPKAYLTFRRTAELSQAVRGRDR